MSARNGSSGGSVDIGAIFRGTAIAFGMTFFISVVLAGVVTVSNWAGDLHSLPWISYISIIIGGFFAAKMSKRIGWLHGIIVAMGYFIVCFILFQGDSTFTQIAYSGGFIKVMTWSVAGAVGGIVGVDL